MAKAAKIKYSQSGVQVNGDLAVDGASGSKVTIKTKTVTMDLSSSHTASAFIPAGALVLSLTARVLTALSGDTTFNGSTWTLGDTDADKWGAGLALAAGTTVDATDWTAGDPAVFASATDVEFGETAGVANAGTIRLVLHYVDITAPTA